jgi:predicted Ser/Thr protein kinase
MLEDKDDPDQRSDCPRCGSVLSYALDGLCPRCIATGGLGGWLDRDEGETGIPDGKIPSAEELAAALPEIEIEELIGRGGMGAVFRGRQVALDRPVAVKVLAIDEAEHPQFAERFRIEAQALARLSHPNIVAVYEFGERDEFFYIVMEFVEGTDLATLIGSGELEPARSLGLVVQICQALQYAHDAGVIHRDIKPANILVDAAGNVRIADFGLAKLLGRDEGLLTTGGERLGTPLYMAPEQRAGNGDIDHRADIFSLGVVFYEMLTGRLPSGKVEPPSRCSRHPVTSRVDPVVMRSMEAEPRRRFQRVSEVGEKVAKIQGGRRWVTAALVGIGLLLGAWLLSSLLNREGSEVPKAPRAGAENEIETVVLEASQRVAPPGLKAYDRAGHALAVRSDGTLCIGVPQGLNRDPVNGAGYVAVMQVGDDGNWTELRRLTPPGDKIGERFGEALVSDDQQLFVNASRSRTVHVYDAPTGSAADTWTISAELRPPPDLVAASFGGEMALRDGVLVTGGRGASGGGAACVFERDAPGGEWQFRQVIRPPESSPRLQFGIGLALEDHMMAVGSRFQDHETAPDCGCIDLFERQPDGVWSHVVRLFPEPLVSDLRAGLGIAFDGQDRVLIGVVQERGVGGSNQGSIQIYERRAADGSWAFSGKINPPGSPPSGSFGRRILIDGDRMLVGSDTYSPTGAERLGCVYEFARDQTHSSGWLAVRQLLPAHGADRGWVALGYQLSRAGGWTALGIPVATNKSGGAYVIRDTGRP